MTGGQQFWGIPVDTTRIVALSAGFIGDFNKNDRVHFGQRLMNLPFNDQHMLWGYWSTLLVALQKASDPIDAGLTLDDKDYRQLNDVILRHTQNEAMTATLLTMVQRVIDRDLGGSRHALAQVYYTPRAMEEYFWCLAASVQHYRFGSYANSVFVVKAAMYRLMLCKAKELIQQHEWCEADLGMAADLVYIINDSETQAPGDDRL